MSSAKFVQKFKDMWNPPEDEFDDYDYDEQVEDVYEDEEPAEEYQEPARHSHARAQETNSNKVVNIHAQSQIQVVLFKPNNFGEDTRAIADELLKVHTVVLNLEDTNKDVSRRILDFLSGVAYANGGRSKESADIDEGRTPSGRFCRRHDVRRRMCRRTEPAQKRDAV